MNPLPKPQHPPLTPEEIAELNALTPQHYLLEYYTDTTSKGPFNSERDFSSQDRLYE